MDNIDSDICIYWFYRDGDSETAREIPTNFANIISSNQRLVSARRGVFDCDCETENSQTSAHISAGKEIEANSGCKGTVSTSDQRLFFCFLCVSARVCETSQTETTTKKPLTIYLEKCKTNGKGIIINPVEPQPYTEAIDGNVEWETRCALCVLYDILHAQ